MLLRPAKIFSPLHQLGKYLEGKVAELVQQQPHISPFQIARKRFYHAPPSSTQQLVHCHSKSVPTLYHVAEQQQQRLLRALQRQFPIVKVFSSPTMVRPFSYQLSFAKSSSTQQFRTIVSSGASGSSAAVGSGGQVEGFAGLCTGGGFFPRAPMVGYARTPFAARQFSTARSPCVTMFQQSTAGPNGMSHISRFFSPAGSKMWIPNANETHGHPSPSPLHHDDDSSAASSGIASSSNGSRRNRQQQQHRHDSSSPLQQQQQQHQQARRSSMRKERRRRHTAAHRYRYDYLHHDELSCRYMPGSEKKPVPSSVRHHWQSSQLKPPPHEPAVVYLSIKLDGTSFWQQHFQDDGQDSSQVLDAAFIGSLHSASELYQMFLAQVVVLLNRLKQHATFETVVSSDSRELRVVFPSSQHWPAEDRKSIACRWLAEIGIDPSSPCFTIEEMDPPPAAAAAAAAITTAASSASMTDTRSEDASDVFGPEYFKGIQTFLDQVDEMIETGPAFGRR